MLEYRRSETAAALSAYSLATAEGAWPGVFSSAYRPPAPTDLAGDAWFTWVGTSAFPCGYSQSSVSLRREWLDALAALGSADTWRTSLVDRVADLLGAGAIANQEHDVVLAAPPQKIVRCVGVVRSVRAGQPSIVVDPAEWAALGTVDQD